jgi:hypothetical protein
LPKLRKPFREQTMDRVRTELIGPLHIHDLQREARRVTLADMAAHADGSGPPLTTRLGALLIRAGCRIEAAGRSRSEATQTHERWTAGPIDRVDTRKRDPS